MAKIFGAILLSIFISVVSADTPANCTYEDIQGSWFFHVGATGFDNTIDCSKPFDVVQVINIELKYGITPDIAVDEYGKEGFWTLIYNQGFEVVIDNKKYFAFSNYTVIDKNVTSYCYSTLNGWVHDIHGYNWACFYGVKDVPDQTISVSRSTKNFNEMYLNRKYIVNNEFIDEINKKAKLWKATHYQNLENMTLHDRLMRAGGIPRHGQYLFPKTASLTTEMLVAVKDLPVNFDWRDVGGTNYISPIRNQKSCGSCYAFGSMAMLEARVRLISNNSLQPVFSTQDIVSCSEYSQGCEGGFPYLIAGKYAEDFGVVEESCFPYSGSDKEHCSREKKGCLRYRVANYHYIGGFYGGCNPELMQKELVENGPIAVSFEVTEDFQSYQSGIYQHTGIEDKFNPWEITNHVVSIIGYGEENGVKFWTVKNSWGEDWGEKGYFRIIRGTDELSIESMAVAASPIIP